MSEREITTPTVNAVSEESAPAQATETPVTEGQVTETPAEPVETPASETTVQEGSEPSKAVKELITQRKRRQEAEKEAAYLKGQLDALQRVAPVQEPARQVVSSDVPPSPEAFETWEEYERAKDEFLVTQAEKRVTAKFQQQAQQTHAQKLRSMFDQRIEEAAKEDPSIPLIVSDSTLPIHQRALPIIYESEVSPQLLKYLDNDRDEAKRLYSLFNSNPILAVREFTKIELKLVNAPKPEPPKKVSLAPEPIKTVTPSGSSVVDEDSLPMEEWVKRRNQAQFKKN